MRAELKTSPVCLSGVEGSVDCFVSFRCKKSRIERDGILSIEKCDVRYIRRRTEILVRRQSVTQISGH